MEEKCKPNKNQVSDIRDGKGFFSKQFFDNKTSFEGSINAFWTSLSSLELSLLCARMGDHTLHSTGIAH